jgi:predicted polyphosphate/ATP-dependent NAD kinase
MNFRRVGILCNPNSGCGKDRVFELTQQAFECLHPQVPEIMVGPGYLGEVVCTGRNVTVIGQNSSGSRIDTIETTKQMVQKGVELFVIVSGDGTYNDAVEGMKSVGVTLPIFGILLIGSMLSVL